MKLFIYIIIAVVSVSCFKTGKNEYYVILTGPVEISHAEIPDTVDNMGLAQIKANAQAYDECWSNLNFTLTKANDFEYSLQAFGLYESYGICPEMMIYGDTTIAFQPTKTGLYKFNIYKSPNDIEIDTMIVR